MLVSQSETERLYNLTPDRAVVTALTANRLSSHFSPNCQSDRSSRILSDHANAEDDRLKDQRKPLFNRAIPSHDS